MGVQRIHQHLEMFRSCASKPAPVLADERLGAIFQLHSGRKLRVHECRQSAYVGGLPAQSPDAVISPRWQKRLEGVLAKNVLGRTLGLLGQKPRLHQQRPPFSLKRQLSKILQAVGYRRISIQTVKEYPRAL